MASQNSLRLIKGNRRLNGRSFEGVSSPVNISLNEGYATKGLIKDIGFGLLTLQFPIDSRWDEQQTVFDLLVSVNKEIIIDGTWTRAGLRIIDNSIIATFQSSLIQKLRSFEDDISPEILLLQSRFRLLDIAGADRNDYAAHLTEIKDYPFPLDVTIRTESNSFQCSFDFRSNLKAVEELTFNYSQKLSATDLEKNQPVTLEYKFLGVRFLCKARVVDIDSDFNFLVLTLPEELIAITARRFDRYRCNISALIANKWLGKIIDVSASGFTVVIHDRFDLANGEVSVYVDSLKLNFQANVKRIQNDKVTLLFCRDEASLHAAMILVANSLDSDMVARNVENYELFLCLDKKADPADVPSEKNALQEWKAASRKIWQIQDDRLPGNMVGVLDNGNMITSLGALPLSPEIAYGHSLRMEKTARSARAMLDVMVHSHVWTDLIPDISFYGGSFSFLARFTTKMHTSFSAQARPIRQKIVNTLRVFPTGEASGFVGAYSVEKTENVFEIIAKEDEALRFLYSILCRPNKIFEDVHKVKTYVVKNESQEAVAVIINHDTPSYFTSVDIFRLVWLLPLKKVEELDSLLVFLRKMPEFASKVFSVDMSKYEALAQLKYGDKVIPYFWTFTGKEELGTLVGSLTRLAYTVLRKYGDEGLEDIAAAFSG